VILEHHLFLAQIDRAQRRVGYARRRRGDWRPYANAVEGLINRLIESGAGSGAPNVGDAMPPFMLPDENGRLVSLKQLTERGPIAVTFHRGHWCP
jgi:hypothetical protein